MTVSPSDILLTDRVAVVTGAVPASDVASLPAWPA